jgi:hypothetical protein
MANPEDSLLGRQSPIAEAHVLYRMIGDENTVEELRELIAVPSRIEHALRAFARAHPEEAHFTDRTLKFREAVTREFERLVRDGVQVVDLPELREVECSHQRGSFRGAVSHERRKRDSTW